MIGIRGCSADLCDWKVDSLSLFLSLSLSLSSLFSFSLSACLSVCLCLCRSLCRVVSVSVSVAVSLTLANQHHTQGGMQCVQGMTYHTVDFGGLVPLPFQGVVRPTLHHTRPSSQFRGGKLTFDERFVVYHVVSPSTPPTTLRDGGPGRVSRNR